MSTTQPSKQPAAERQAADAHIRMLITTYAPTQLRLITATRKQLRTLLPTAYEVVYEYRDCFVVSFSPSQHGYEGIFAIRASDNEVKFYFNNGKPLSDPEKLLQGTGNQTRWIQLHSPSTLSAPAIMNMIDQAIAENSVPFASDGNGWIIKSAKAVKADAKKSGKQKRVPAQRGTVVSKKVNTKKKVRSRKKTARSAAK